MLKSENVYIGRYDEQTSVTRMYHIRDLGAKFPAAWQFFVIFFEKKIAILMPLNHILRVFRVISKLDF